MRPVTSLGFTRTVMLASLVAWFCQLPTVMKTVSTSGIARILASRRWASTCVPSRLESAAALRLIWIMPWSLAGENSVPMKRAEPRLTTNIKAAAPRVFQRCLSDQFRMPA
ncbi:hypothetical protein D3C72_362540 [compost metagenome]